MNLIKIERAARLHIGALLENEKENKIQVRAIFILNIESIDILGNPIYGAFFGTGGMIQLPRSSFGRLFHTRAASYLNDLSPNLVEFTRGISAILSPLRL